MNPLTLVQLCVYANVPVIMWGPPGKGKTAVLPQLAHMMGFTSGGDSTSFKNRTGYMSTSMAIAQPEDIGGMGFATRDEDTMSRKHDDYWQAVVNEPTFVVLDEFNRAPNMATYSAALRLLQERQLGSKPVHHGTRFVLTGNPTTSDGASELPPAAANRTAHVEWTPDGTLFRNYMRGGAGVAATPVRFNQEEYDAALPATKQLIAAFLEARPNMDHVEPDAGAIAGKPWGRTVCGPWPSWRSWENYARTLTVLGLNGDIRYGKNGEVAFDLGCALVGISAATEFISFLCKSDLRNGREVLDHVKAGNPYYVKGAPNTRIDIMWAEVTSAAMTAYTNRGTNTQDTELAFGILAELVDTNPAIVMLSYSLLLDGGAAQSSQDNINMHIVKCMAAKPEVQRKMQPIVKELISSVRK